MVYEGIGTDDILYYYDSYGTFAGLQYFPNGSNGAMYYAATNMQGDVIGLYDASGTLVVSYEYDAWGKLLSITDTTTIGIGAINPIRYRGYYYDSETGLYYLQSRYYDPETCRFINVDGYVSTGQGVFGHNSYLYCANNPVNRVDEAGTCYYNANGEWRHDNWEYLGGYVRKPDPNATTISTPKEPALIVPTPPDLTSSAYREDNALYNAGFEGQCTWYAYGRALEVAGVRMPTRDAKKWYDATNLNKGSEIRSNSVAVFSSSQWGHVVYIEVWDPATNTVIFSEGNLKNIPDGEFQTNTLDYLLYRWSDYTLVGYIYTD